MVTVQLPKVHLFTQPTSTSPSISEKRKPNRQIDANTSHQPDAAVFAVEKSLVVAASNTSTDTHSASSNQLRIIEWKCATLSSLSSLVMSVDDDDNVRLSFIDYNVP